MQLKESDIKPSPQLRLLSLSFNLPIYPRQISQWRGAFIEMAGWQNDLFHNHNTTNIAKPQSSTKHHFRYPLIQYRIRNRQAALLAINEGADALQQILASSDWQINWEGQQQQLKIEDFQMQEHYFRMLPQPRQYKLFKWLPFNSDNYKKWQDCRNASERADLMERILASNLIAVFANFGWRLPERMEVTLDRVLQESWVQHKNVKMIAFNVLFICNVLLPPQLAIGKSVSAGFGWQVPMGRPYFNSNKPSITGKQATPKDPVL